METCQTYLRMNTEYSNKNRILLYVVIYSYEKSSVATENDKTHHVPFLHYRYNIYWYQLNLQYSYQFLLNDSMGSNYQHTFEKVKRGNFMF